MQKKEEEIIVFVVGTHIHTHIHAISLSTIFFLRPLNTDSQIARSSRFGTSVGSGPSCYLAEKYKRVKGLILETPFTSIARIVAGGNIFSLAWDMFPNIDRIEKIDCPVFIIHGTSDSVVPFEHGRVCSPPLPPPSLLRFLTYSTS